MQGGTLQPLSHQPGLLGSPQCSFHLAVLLEILSLPLAPHTDSSLLCLCSWIEEQWLQLIPGRSRRCRRLCSRYGGKIPNSGFLPSLLGLLGHMYLLFRRLGVSRGSHRGCSSRVSGSHSGADQTLQQGQEEQ